MYYPLYDLVGDDKAFENLVASICEEILGMGTITFSKGKDGGRDAKFNGRANSFPSKSKPWEGKIVIQAKHTTAINAKCTDPDFKRIIKKEVIDKVQKLIQKGKLDFYILFTNRKLSSLEDMRIEDLISHKISVDNYVIGEERIQKWLNDYPKIVKSNNLNKLLLPLQFYDNDLKDIIIEFSKIVGNTDAIKEINNEFQRIEIEKKNRINVLTEDYFNNVLKDSINEFQQITNFLEDPKNTTYKTYYKNTVDDLQAKIIINRDDYSTFEKIIDYLCDYVMRNNEAGLKDNRRLIRLFLHYMYYYCDIGKKE